MIYTVKKANLIGEQLRKFSTSTAWIVVGQFANLDFWMAEVKTALSANGTKCCFYFRHPKVKVLSLIHI